MKTEGSNAWTGTKARQFQASPREVTRFRNNLARLAPAVKLQHIRTLENRARARGHLHDLAQVLLEMWDFENAHPLLTDRVVHIIVAAGLRREAVDLIEGKSFSGASGCAARLKALFPQANDHVQS